jgi:hypothetical protein
MVAADYHDIDRPTEHLGMAVWLVATARAECPASLVGSPRARFRNPGPSSLRRRAAQ